MTSYYTISSVRAGIEKLKKTNSHSKCCEDLCEAVVKAEDIEFIFLLTGKINELQFLLFIQRPASLVNLIFHVMRKERVLNFIKRKRIMMP
ncbi:hypothetical protein SAMN05660909_03126 [Chitinophaga terrae (ex Kim and Jung 2007)]|uniref:Uncharacterized protein n=1 Tax=Chitinophaga terrae (ex Kim and Jung 2007) TaxID=408074 RepID=A0A1H4DHR8_9BACT|nr:hypothetical protein [Chitinophaga terrae (ex Kim and Jung 2007)]SEA71792.1 hypothetical protein SAMN05660909_03126 [Chitinophaga terrae (ex Kim and Jung 2007)]